MKKLIFTFLSLGLLALQVNAQTEKTSTSTTNINRNSFTVNDDRDPSKSKTFSKTFNLDKDDKIDIIGKYSSITIKTWDKKEAQLDADIKAYALSEREAQDLLDSIAIDANKTENIVSFKTSIKSNPKHNFFGSGTNNGERFRREARIKMTLYIPATVSLKLTNKYGDVNMEDFAGEIDVDMRYGNFKANNLSNTRNNFEIRYGKLNLNTVNELDLNAHYTNVNIETIKGNAKIEQRYNELTIGTVNNLNLNTRYVNTDIGDVKGDASINQQYNSLRLGNVGKLDLTTRYTNAKIKNLNGNGDFNMQYNSLDISNITAACKTLNLETRYVNTDLAFVNGYDANFDITTSNGSFKYGNNVTAKRVSEESRTQTYTGKIGKGSAANVNVTSGYGSVRFN